MGKLKRVNQKQRFTRAKTLLDGIFKELCCVVCGRPAVAHHMIPKGRSLLHKYQIRNLIPLCAGPDGHHMWNQHMAAHSPHKNTIVTGRFWVWLTENLPAHAKWYEEHNNDPPVFTAEIMQSILEELEEIVKNGTGKSIILEETNIY